MYKYHPGAGQATGDEPADATELARQIALGDLSGNISLKAGDSESMLAQVMSAIRHVTEIVREISAASSEQAQGVLQMGEAITRSGTDSWRFQTD